MRKRIAVLSSLFAASVLGLGANAALAAKIIVGNAAGDPGATVSVDVTLAAEGAQVAGTQNDIAFDASTPIARKANGRPDCTVNGDIDKTGTSFAFRPTNCAEGACTSIRALVLSTENVTAVPDGAILYTCRVAIGAGATSGAKALAITGVIASDPEGTRVNGTTGQDGSVTVNGGSQPTATPTETSGSTCDPVRGAPSGNAIYIEDQNLDAGTASGTITARLVTTTAVAGSQNDISLGTGVKIKRKANGRPDCTVNGDIDKTGTSFAFRPNGCAEGACTAVRALVLSTENVTAIPTGSVLYTCNVDITAADELQVTGTILSSPEGTQVAGVTSQSGKICLGGGSTEPTVTPTQVQGGMCPAVRPAPSGNAIYVVDQNPAAVTASGVIEVKLVSNTDVAGSQNDISLPAGAVIKRKANGRPDCTVNPDIDKTGTSFAFRPNGCAEGACTGVRALVLSTENVTAIPSGSTLYTCNVDITNCASLDVTGVILSTPAGQAITGATGQNGNVCIESICGGSNPTPVATATPTTPSVPNPTATNTNRPTATNTTGVAATATPSPTRTTAVQTPGLVEEEDGCQISATGGSSSAAWLMLIPALAMLVRRRSR